MASCKRILLVHPGVAWSTHDVYKGLRQGFLSAGIEVYPYRMDERLSAAQDWIDFTIKRYGDVDQKADLADIAYQASKGAVVRALEVAADAIVIVSGLLFEGRAMVLCRRAGIPVLVVGTESPYDDDLYANVGSLASYLTVNEPSSASHLQAVFDDKANALDETACKVSYLPLGYDERFHYPGAGAGGATCDVAFVGTFFPERIEFLEAVDWTGIDLALYGATDWLSETSSLRQYLRGGVVDNLVTTSIHAGARIPLNLFRTSSSLRTDRNEFLDVPGGESINPRCIELAACGKFFLSEYRPCIHDVFGDLIPTFTDPGSLEFLIREWLKREDEIAILNSRLPDCVAEYSYKNHAIKLANILDNKSLGDDDV